MKNVRLYDHVYTVPVNVTAGIINNASTPIYFTGYPYLRDKRIKGISVSSQAALFAAGDPFFITLVNSKGEQLVYNWPLNDLVITRSGVNESKLRLFDLYDIDLNNSYWINALNVGWASTTTLFRINFYY